MNDPQFFLLRRTFLFHPLYCIPILQGGSFFPSDAKDNIFNEKQWGPGMVLATWECGKQRCKGAR
jgi:hypothetical protein